MPSYKLLLAEIRFRKLNFFLSVLAVVAAATLFVAGPSLIESYGRQTDQIIGEREQETADELAAMDDRIRVLMRDMGFNLMIVDEETNMGDFWASDYAAVDMPQSYVDRLASAEELTLVTHLVATLQQKIKWQDRTVLLVGYLPEVTQSHMRKKKPMGYAIEPGTVYLGHELGQGHDEGDEIEILGQKFTIAKILPEKGSKEDITIAMSLGDAQRTLDKPDKVNQIMALGCRCAGERLPQIRAQLAAALPGTKITEFRSIALARAETRDMFSEKSAEMLAALEASRESEQQRMESFTTVFTPIVVLGCAIWIGILALANVRQRRQEIGLLRALGKGSAAIVALLLSKAILVGLLGGIIGFGLGIWLVRAIGLPLLDIPIENFGVSYELLIAAVVGAPLVSVLAAYLPTLMAVIEHPAAILRDI